MKVELYSADVGHVRTQPRRHNFFYKVFYLRLIWDLSIKDNQEVPAFFSLNKFNLLSISSTDYLEGKSGPLIELLLNFIKSKNIVIKPHKVTLQTFPKMLFYIFNPVSFWKFYDEKNNLLGILVEVNNTFGERHFYWIDKDHDNEMVKKVFHVSPFFQVAGYYKFNFNNNRVDINYFSDDNDLLLQTYIDGQEVEIKRNTMLTFFIKYYYMGYLVIFRIHWQAMCLLLKKIPFYRKPSLPISEISK